ncbi:hypothetical protein J5N97_000662 [Dioscorea zingiberensis]|uniref:PPC domain-containing protein n=1 Tax=Dioscorea zingiberensis TaxID=325984 RepID=A0A9D5H2Z0_9LILI|nr:hypothetical protein J5N97_000662 [Dioscorea zingiberensis]
MKTNTGLEMVSIDVDSRSTDEPRLKQKNSGVGGGDGSSIELVRRPRGRPPGSKNKPKPPVIITRDADPPTSMRAHVLEIRAGHDVVEAIADFSRRRGIGVCVLAGSGAVSNVTLRQPPAPALQAPASGPAATVVFRGRFELLSLSATVFPPSELQAPPSVSVSLSGPHGQVVGGTVAGPLMAAGSVVLFAAGFSNPSFHRLPPDNDDVPDISPGGGGGGASASADPDSTPVHRPHSHHHHQHHHLPPAVSTTSPETCSSHLPSDVIWAQAPRPSHPF